MSFRHLLIGFACLSVACGGEADPQTPPSAVEVGGSGGATSGTGAGSGAAGASSSSGVGGAASSTGAGGDGGSVASSTSGQLSVLCYNVHGLPAVVTGDNTGARMAAIGPLLNGFDLVALQEDFMPQHHGTLTGASTHAESLWFDAKVDATRVYGAGLTAFADATIVQHHHEHYDACNGTIDASNDCLSSKGFQMVRVELAPGAEVDLYNTHLDAGGGTKDDAARQAQVVQLLAAIDHWSTDRAVLVVGDTNLEEDDPDEAPALAQLIADAGLSDTCDAMTCSEPGRIERILFRSGASLDFDVTAWTNEPAFENGGQPLSDHPAISAVFDWALVTP